MYNACDTLRNMPEIIQRSLGEKGKTLPFFKLHVPMVPPEQTDSKGYFADRIHELITAIETHSEYDSRQKGFLLVPRYITP